MTTFKPVQLPHQTTPKSGRFSRLLTKEAKMPKQIADELPETIAAQGGVLIPKQFLTWAIILMLGSGFGGPALNNFFARGVSQDAATISEQGKLLVSMLERFDKKLEEIGDHIDDLDARMTRLERADRASKSKEAQQ